MTTCAIYEIFTLTCSISPHLPSTSQHLPTPRTLFLSSLCPLPPPHGLPTAFQAFPCRHTPLNSLPMSSPTTPSPRVASGGSYRVQARLGGGFKGG
ncbi:hypothetical protein E2C01_055257 [Portunus trituberculatus]|uniref:Uncharacterized protein n=1 Tax=Portunus trituberculatus TaxID=210409 RepID=A0A5B7GM91_PORTR|nr:hypothetical protein [Portunus trituberculatus]